MSGFVVDAGVALKWLVEEPGAELAMLLLDHPLAAPDLLGPECVYLCLAEALGQPLIAADERLVEVVRAGPFAGLVVPLRALPTVLAPDPA